MLCFLPEVPYKGVPYKKTRMTYYIKSLVNKQW